MSEFGDDRTQIADVLTRYATGIDRRDWALFRACWTDDIDADYGDTGQFTSADEICEFMTAAHAPMGDTHHCLSNIVIDVQGDNATARTYIHAVLMVAPSDPDAWVDVVGHYDDQLTRTTDGWRIYKRRVHLSRVLANLPSQIDGA